MSCHLWPEKLQKHSYSISNIVLCDKTAATWGNLCEVRSMLSQEKVRRNSDIERWNTEPKQFNRMCHLLPGKLPKNSYSISNDVLRVNMASKQGNLCEVWSMSPPKKVKRRNSDIAWWNTEPKQFNRNCHLLPGKLGSNKTVIHFEKWYNETSWRPRKEIHVEFRARNHKKS